MRKLLAATAFLIGSGSLAQAATCSFGDSILSLVTTTAGTGAIAGYTGDTNNNCTGTTIPFALSAPALISISLSFVGDTAPAGLTYDVTIDGNTVSPDPTAQISDLGGDDAMTAFDVLIGGGQHVLGITISDGTEAAALDFGLSVRNYVPEPATMAVLGAGLLGLGFARRRRS